MQVCQQLKKLRCGLNLSQERFGVKAGISGKSVSAYETGRCIPSVRVLRRIANEYNVDIAELSNDSRKYLNESIDEIESSVTKLKEILSQILS